MLYRILMYKWTLWLLIAIIGLAAIGFDVYLNSAHPEDPLIAPCLRESKVRQIAREEAIKVMKESK